MSHCLIPVEDGQSNRRHSAQHQMFKLLHGVRQLGGSTKVSMRSYLNPTEVEQFLQDVTSVLPLPGLPCPPAQSEKHGGDSSRQGVTLVGLDRAAEGPQLIRRTSICSFVQEVKG